MTKDEFVVHACEQVLRFTRAATWDDLSEKLKVQLGFNMGVAALGLGLSKEEGFLALSDLREGIVSMDAFRERFHSMIVAHKIVVDGTKIARPF